MEEIVNIVGASKYAYSDKIKNRRRTLFPCENSEMVNKFSDNSDMDQINPLSTSDSEGESYEVSNNISLIASTNLVSDILSTPNSKNYPPSEQSMSPLYLSPYGNMVIAKSVLSELSPTKRLKTPNYSNIHCGIPKLSRKCSSEQTVDRSDSKESDMIPNPPKTSKVRTTLFPELDTTSLAPKHFYPKVDFHKPVSGQKVSKQMKVQRSTKRKNDSKRLFGLINIGVKHNIKKPKKRKIVSETKISQAQLARIKTFKKDKLINSELNEFMKDLSELSERKKVRLIQYSSSQDTVESKEDNTSSLKRANDSIDDTICKKQKLISEEGNTVPLHESANNFEATECLNENSEILCTKNIDEILYLIDNSISQDKENNCEDKENDLNIVENCSPETLLSPTSQMCNMASVMNIDSPKKAKNLNFLFQNMSDNNAESSATRNTRMNNEKPNQGLYFPIFYPSSKLTKNSDSDIKKPEFSVKRKKMKISSDQMLLDAGQKRFGLTECCQCKYVYNAGDPNDETMHNNHHNATNVLQFSGWKNEHLVETFPNGRIIQVMPTDSKIWIDKVKRVIEVINRDMGYFDMTFDIGAAKVFLLILNKNIIGCLVAERKTIGFKVLSSQEGIDLCSTEEFAIKCGVSRIWVAPQFRKKGVATKLMNTLKSHFIHGQLLKNCDIALSSPTTDGKLFAAKYFQTNNFFTYFD